MSIVRVVGDALDKRFLADVERKSLGEGGAVGHGAVATDTSVGKGILKRLDWSGFTDLEGTYLVALILSSRAAADLWAGVQLGVAPVDCLDQQGLYTLWTGILLLHASVEEMLAGLKAAVAAGGISWETVVEAATEAALEVTMV